MEILNKIKFNYSEALNPKSKPFTREHTIFNCKISHNRKSYSFEYQCNPNYSEPKLDEVLECLITDMGCYECSRDIVDFAEELGYDPTSFECQKAYDGCKKESKALHRLFTDEELSLIQDDLYYCS